MSRASLWFVVPAHGRHQLTQICLRQLRHTCDNLTHNGIHATAVVIATDKNLDTAQQLGFGTIERDNQFVSRRFNDGFQLATDPNINPNPADYVMPLGSDDWIDWRILNQDTMPAENEIVGFPQITFVRGDGQEMTRTYLDYTGGSGMRIYPRELLAPLGYRPADEDRYRGCDTSILTNVRQATPNVRVMHVGIDARQIVDWKTPGAQLNEYEQVQRRHCRNGTIHTNPFRELAGYYPDDALDEMAAYYGALVAA